jgi:hypothetical protein
MMKKLIVLLLLLVPCTGILAQEIGKWQGTVACEQCPEPYAMGFGDEENGIILTKSVVQGGEKMTTALRTTDGGSHWLSLIDTSTLAVRYGKSLAMNYYLPNYIVDVTSYDARFSTDTGKSWENYIGYNLTGYAATIKSPSTYHLFATDISLSTGRFITSADTGKSYDFYGDGLYLDSDIISSVSMPDSNDVWVTTFGSSKQHLFHTDDAGLTWNELYPFSPVDTENCKYGVLLAGATKGTIYLYSTEYLNNLIGSGTPIERSIALIYTTDNGVNWSADTTNHTKFTLLQNSGGEELWGIVDGTRTIAYSSNNGKSWAYDSTTFKDEPIWLMYWKDISHGYILTYKDNTTKAYRWIRPSSVIENKVFFTIQDLKIFPVIASEIVKLVPRIPLKGALEIYDMLGRQHLSRNIVWDEKQIQTIDVRSLSSGVYLLVVRTERDVSSVRFIKE